MRGWCCSKEDGPRRWSGASWPSSLYTSGWRNTLSCPKACFFSTLTLRWVFPTSSSAYYICWSRQATAIKSTSKGEMRIRVRGEDTTRMNTGNTTPRIPTVTTACVLIGECISPSQPFISRAFQLDCQMHRKHNPFGAEQKANIIVTIVKIMKIFCV